MEKAKLLEVPKRGYAKITERGLELLQQQPEKIDRKFLLQYPEFVEFQQIEKKNLNKKKQSEHKMNQSVQKIKHLKNS